jgi:hypothetical protein
MDSTYVGTMSVIIARQIVLEPSPVGDRGKRSTAALDARVTPIDDQVGVRTITRLSLQGSAGDTAVSSSHEADQTGQNFKKSPVRPIMFR